MTLNDFQAGAIRTVNTELSYKDQLLNAVLGATAETGEAGNMIKKHFFQGHDLDRNQVMNELGDILWYVAVCADTLELSLQEVAEHNAQKLRSRYPEAFSTELSRNRRN